jgi:hypothetical protein
MWKAIAVGLIVCICNISAMQNKSAMQNNKHKKTQSNLQFLVQNGNLDKILGKKTVEKLSHDASLSEEEKKKEEYDNAYTPKTMGQSWKACYEEQKGKQQSLTQQATTINAVKNAQKTTGKEKVMVDCCC